MLSLEIQEKVLVYLTISCFSVYIWDMFDNVKNDYRLSFRHRLGPLTLIYFVSRIAVLCCIGCLVIYLTTSFIDCAAFKSAMIGLFIVGQMGTVVLSFFRVCAVWQWNRYVVGFFGLTSLSIVVTTCFTLIRCFKPIDSVHTCTMLIEGPLIPAPFITIIFNHTALVLAITYGICKDTMSDLTFRDGILLMLGRSLPAFSKALLHDSQVSYIIIVGVSLASFIWLFAWKDVVPSASPFRFALIPVSIIVSNIMICRVYRDMKLGIYKQPMLLQSIDPKSQNFTPENHMFPLSPSSGIHIRIDQENDSEAAIDKIHKFDEAWTPTTRKVQSREGNDHESVEFSN